MKKLEVGDRVRVKTNHWKRANNLGTVTQFMEDGRYEITFDHKYVGGGVGGDKLYLQYGVDFDIA